ncbi:hypothetical protein VTO42DRAFT_1047 [Malbranchea cinnamomea]
MALNWTAQFTVTPPDRSQILAGDRISLPPSVLEHLLSLTPVSLVTTSASGSFNHQFDPFHSYTFAAERHSRELHVERQHQLPQPLTFRLVNPDNGRVVHAGIREFTSEEGEITLSPWLRQSLGFQDSDFQPNSQNIVVAQKPAADENGIRSHPGKQPKVTVHAAQLCKGTYVRLRPLEPGYDSENWKALLERYLRDNFTTLTVGEILPVQGEKMEPFRFLIDRVQPKGDAICIVDTDLEVDIEALDEDQARETARRRLAKVKTRPSGSNGESSFGGELVPGEEVVGKVSPGEYVDYEIPRWDREKTLEIDLSVEDGSVIDIFVSPLSSRQRSRPRSDEHVFGDFSSAFPKRLYLRPSHVELDSAELLYVAVHKPIESSNEQGNFHEGTLFRLKIKAVEGQHPASTSAQEAIHELDDVQCRNCHQLVPRRALLLHENFCFRHNVLCPKCDGVFQRRSPEWENHWHCPYDDAHGNSTSGRLRHDNVFHAIHICPGCNFQATSLPELAQHRTTTCPAKPILCQFCHLIVPQKGDNEPDVLDPEVLLSGLTPHELVDGSRTTECHLCNRIIRLRDMKTHLRHHELERKSRPPPVVCINPNCCQVIDGVGRYPEKHARTNAFLGLCNVCFGPLYTELYDPEGKALRRRIERKLLFQVLTGCRKSWCRNIYCKTGCTNLGDIRDDRTSGTLPQTPKDALAFIKPLVDSVSVRPESVNTTPLYFCTDETTQHRKEMVDVLVDQEQGQYERIWCIAAVDRAAGDLQKAKRWLRDWAPRKGERS